MKILARIFRIAIVFVAATAYAAAQTDTSSNKVDSHADKSVHMATVFIYRFIEPSASGKVPVYIDDKQSASLANGRFLTFLLDPGKHNFKAKSAEGEPLSLSLERGRKYYLRVDQMGKKQQFRLLSVDDERGVAEVRQLTPIEPADINDKTLAIINQQ